MAEIKSRYEVIAELEEKKRSLILDKNGIESNLKYKERQLRDMKREVEDKESEIEEFKADMKKNAETAVELIKSIDESLARFTELSNKK